MLSTTTSSSTGGAKRGRTVTDGLAQAVEADMHRKQRKRLGSAVETNPELLPKLLELIESGKLAKDSAGAKGVLKLPPSCNKFYLLSKERCQVVLSALSSKYTVARTRPLSRIELQRMIRFTCCLGEKCALPSNSGMLQNVLSWCQRRMGEVKVDFNSLLFKEEKDQIVVDWTASGYFQLKKDRGAGPESPFVQIGFISGQVVPLDPVLASTYSIKNNHDIVNAEVVSSAQPWKSHCKAFFDKLQIPLPEQLTLETMRDSQVKRQPRLTKREALQVLNAMESDDTHPEAAVRKAEVVIEGTAEQHPLRAVKPPQEEDDGEDTDVVPDGDGCSMVVVNPPVVNLS
eukprot:6492413-Amphidinium_carterae.3